MPDCSEELLDALEIRAELFSSISQLLSEMTLEEIVEGCFRGLNPEILEEMPLRLQCDCSRDYIERVLLSMGEDRNRDMLKNRTGVRWNAISAESTIVLAAKSWKACSRRRIERMSRTTTENSEEACHDQGG